MSLFQDETGHEVPGLSKDSKASVFPSEPPIPFENDDDDSFGPLGQNEPVSGQPAFVAAEHDEVEFEDDDSEIFAEAPSSPPPPVVRAPSRPFAEPAKGLDFEPEDDFASETDDLGDFSYPDDDDDEEEGVAPKKNFLVPAVAVISTIFVVVMGYFAYKAVFASHPAPRAVSSLSQTIPMNNSASQVPVHATSPSAPAQPTIVPVSQPAPVIQQPQPQPQPMTVPADAAAAVQSPLVERHVEAPTSMISADMKALSDRVAALESAKDDTRIADLQKAVDDDHAREDAYKSQIAALQAAVDGLKSQMKGVSEKAAAAAVKARAAVVAARAAKADEKAPSDDTPPLKPAVLSGYQLKGISQGGAAVAAWIDTGKGIVKVVTGDKVNGAGVVREIRKTGNGWVVVTSKGIIVP